MKNTILLGLILATLLSSCRLPHKLAEVKSDNRNIEVWESENSSVKVSGHLRFSYPPSTFYNRAGWVKFRIRVKSPERKIQILSDEVRLYWHCNNTNLTIPVPIKENTLSNLLYKETKRERYTVTGIITLEIWEKMFYIDNSPDTGEFELHLPEFTFESDTLTLSPIRFYKKPHWLYSNPN
ncbi:MAG: hypothetical protein EA409_00355 [Saprospirales bacterium]|nr:MAG: hypothetical protein EA409_00355 [Saprospirales bacterium]